MRKSSLLLGVLAVGAAFALTGCGKTSIDATQGLVLEFSGYDGYGTAYLDSNYGWLQEASSISMEKGQPLSYSAVSGAVSYTIEPSENLSNGDVVTVTAEINESLLESYSFTLSGGSQTFTVAGLKEVEEFDPFENVSVSFEGFSPEGTASISRGASSSSDVALNYQLDKTNGLSNGDKITMTVSGYGGSTLEDYCLGFGKIPTATEKEFTVEGLASYAMKIDDIPQDMMAKMDKQAHDVLEAHAASNWAKESKLSGMELIGNYFLAPKEGVNTSTKNYLYLVYKVKANIGKNSHDVTVGDVSYYYYVCFNNIIILEDGTCSVNLNNYNTPTNNYKVEYKYDGFFGESTGNYNFYGYGDLDSMFSDCVTQKISTYTYENTVVDTPDKKDDEKDKDKDKDEDKDKDKDKDKDADKDKDDKSEESEAETEKETKADDKEDTTEEATKEE